mmetsp:Transcript_41411/g.96818  ORF Transcript_41411/g.96818 Transcript_41411/m.96818 type:complete len:82 (-) Transcript_41411:449-694(-)
MRHLPHPVRPRGARGAWAPALLGAVPPPRTRGDGKREQAPLVHFFMVALLGSALLRLGIDSPSGRSAERSRACLRVRASSA